MKGKVGLGSNACGLPDSPWVFKGQGLGSERRLCCLRKTELEPKDGSFWKTQGTVTWKARAGTLG